MGRRVVRPELPAGVRGDSNRNRGWVYVFLVRAAGVIKVGYTASPQNRLGAIAGSCPLPIEVLLLEKGSFWAELALKHRWRESLSHGEWFRFDGVVLEDISSGAAAAMVRSVPRRRSWWWTRGDRKRSSELSEARRRLCGNGLSVTVRLVTP